MKFVSGGFMRFTHVNGLFLCLAVLVSSLAEGASFLAESGQTVTCAIGQSQMQCSPAEESLDNFPIILAGLKRDQCSAGCDGELQSCVDRCPGFDEDKVVDPYYAARKCKAACDAVMSQCKSGCPTD
jgi:hypothetical protein